jgi:hypothetical protein
MTARPRRRDVERLAEVRAPWCVTVYGSWDDWMGGPRLETRAGEQVRAVERLLQQTGAPEDVAAALVRRLRELPATDGAADGRTRSIAIFAADGVLEVFALTTAPAAWVGVSDRFLIAPLLEAVLALIPPVFALALSENQVRLIDVTSAPPRVVHVGGSRTICGRSSISTWRVTATRSRTSRSPRTRRCGCGRSRVRWMRRSPP